MGFFHQVCVLSLLLLLAMRHGLGSPTLKDVFRKELLDELRAEKDEHQRRSDKGSVPDPNQDRMDISDLIRRLAVLIPKSEVRNSQPSPKLDHARRTYWLEEDAGIRAPMPPPCTTRAPPAPGTQTDGRRSQGHPRSAGSPRNEHFYPGPLCWPPQTSPPSPPPGTTKPPPSPPALPTKPPTSPPALPTKPPPSLPALPTKPPTSPPPCPTKPPPSPPALPTKPPIPPRSPISAPNPPAVPRKPPAGRESLVKVARQARPVHAA